MQLPKILTHMAHGNPVIDAPKKLTSRDPARKTRVSLPKNLTFRASQSPQGTFAVQNGARFPETLTAKPCGVP
jgi:hypothetical protein